MDFLYQDVLPKLKSKKPRANDLTGKEWLKSSVSIWTNLSKDNEERASDHPAVFPWKLAHKVIEVFTDQTKNNILDPFVGSGSTLIACHKLNKNGIGFDINKEYISLANKRVKKLSTKKNNKSYIKLITGNALNIRKYVPNEIIDLCFTALLIGIY